MKHTTDFRPITVAGEKYPKGTLKFYIDCPQENMKGAAQRNYIELVKSLKWLRRLPEVRKPPQIWRGNG